MGGSTFTNTPQAQDDVFTANVTGLTEDHVTIVYLTVTANDLGGNAKTLWSVDNGVNNTGAMSGYIAADLLKRDAARAEATSGDTSLNGAKIWITNDGKVGYDACTLSAAFKAQLNSLGTNQTLTDSFIYAIRLGNGTLSWATAVVQFGCSNNAVTITIAPQSGLVVEDAPLTPDPGDSLSATGTISFADVDLSDCHTASFVAAPGNTTALGTFSLDPVSEEANVANGSVQWHYALNNGAAQYLAAGQCVTEQYVVTLNDGHGSTTTQTVNVVITGINDVVSITSGAQAGTVVEDATTTPDLTDSLNAAGTVCFTDVDLSDCHTASFVAAPGNTTALGTFSLDPVSEEANVANGSVQWHYALNNGAAQYLAAGQSVVEHYTVTVDDGQGSTATKVVTITIIGTNDPMSTPIDIDAAVNSVAENAAIGTLVGVTAFTSDPDATDTVTYSLVGDANGAFQINAGTGVVTVLDGSHIDRESAASLGITVRASSSDGSHADQAFTIAVNNTNEAPTNTVPGAQTATEDTAKVFNSGNGSQISISDVDDASHRVTLIATNGAITLNGTSGLLFTVGDGTSDGTMTFSGTDASINAALNGLSFLGATNFNGAASIQIVTTDGDLSDTDSVAITVNAALVINPDAANEVPAISSLAITSTSISFVATDPDNANLSLSSAFAAAFGNPTVISAATTVLTPTEQTSGVVGVLRVTDGSATADVVNLYLGTGFGTTMVVGGSVDTAMYGFGGNDGLGAGSGADWLFGGSGNDTLFGAQNDRVLDGGTETDTLQVAANFTSTGDAQIVNTENVLLTVGATLNLSKQTEGFAITGSSGVDSITGGSGADTINGQAGNDSLFGLSGNDRLLGLGGSDLLVGGAGNDTVYGDAGNDTVWGDAGNDTIYGGEGDDKIVGGSGADHIDGGLGNDTVRGDAGNDIINGGGGGDRIIGDAGNDTLNGGLGNDTVWGDAGDDTIYGGEGDDKIVGGSGADRIDGGLGNDTVRGDAGNDIINGGGGGDRIIGDAGNDTLNGGLGNDTVWGDAGDDTIYGGEGDDKIVGGSGADRIDGGLGNDTVWGDAGNDIINGGGGGDRIIGDAGNDTLNGGLGNDTVWGDAGNDTIYGGEGDDKIVGGSGADHIDGGLGNDTVWGDDGNDIINGGGGGDRIIGDAGNDTLNGGLGNDTVWGDAGNDTIYGDEGDDKIVGGSGADRIDGGLGNDTVWGDAGNDRLLGQGGNDTLFGDFGKDASTGGAGNDIFKFTATWQSTVGANADVITDFDDFGNDTINLAAVYGGSLAYRHNGAFTAAGQVRINDIAGADVIVEVNTGGTLAADMQIRLTGTTLGSMTASDFFL